MTREEYMRKLVDMQTDISAYKQEPCSDLIQRQAVNEIINDIRNCISVEGYWAILERMKKLPSVNQQEPCEDAISRQAVMDCFKKWQPYMATRLWDFEQELSALPSINPQPCEDAISRQAVNILVDELARAISDERCCMSRGRSTATIMQDILDLPSVKPQEPTGHWQHYEGMLICSECGAEFYDDIMEYCGDDVPKCCPDCGIRMVDPQESEEV